MTPTIYSFYNNKGGVGKTTLCAQVATQYAHQHDDTEVLVIDLCPQSNVSHFLLGGGHVGYMNNQSLQQAATRKNVVGFVDWLLNGNSKFQSLSASYKTSPSKHNPAIPDNLKLIAGDSFLESLGLALNYAIINPANTAAWAEFMTAIRRLCAIEASNFSNYKKMVAFIDCNPSFAVYTQMALVSSDYLIVPMMADFTSMEGLRSLFMLLYGIFPSAAQQNYAQNVITFNKQVRHFKLNLPKFFEFAFNNYTKRVGVAGAYDSIRTELVEFVYQQYASHGGLFAATDKPISSIAEFEDYFVSDIKDFHTVGKVSASLGIPIYSMPDENTYHMPNGERIKIPSGNYATCLTEVAALVDKIH